MNFVVREWLTYLECNHCGGTAIEADAQGCFTDGDGGKCVTCGFPGCVSCDSESEPYWSTSDQEPGPVCDDPSCQECRPIATTTTDCYLTRPRGHVH